MKGPEELNNLFKKTDFLFSIISDQVLMIDFNIIRIERIYRILYCDNKISAKKLKIRNCLPLQNQNKKSKTTAWNQENS
ncbi:hypothetical protein BpHYR1_038615 [Brachionus plicatilis]|uniref:Uncharacterized protein n=1 Tax=Brachionus plicatilis TaxID=10195 RepID=A0A3M7QLY0_BRAPC|nr:hypothetical protein BpHYR1_038615 [Brachionus plicatilis]